MLLGKMCNPDDRFVWHQNSAYSKLPFKVNGIRWSITVFEKHTQNASDKVPYLKDKIKEEKK